MAKKTSPKANAPKINKSAFVRGLPASMSASDVVKAAAAKGVKLSDKFVHTIRYNAKRKAAKGASKPSVEGAVAAASPVVKRAPGRPRKAVAGGEGGVGGGIVGEIERIVEKAVSRIMHERLGTLFSR